MSGLLDHFSALSDPRQRWKVLYPLPEILLVVLCGVMSGADDFVEIADWAEEKLGFLRRFLPFERGIPSHDTLNEVMNALPSRLFSECFAKWVDELRTTDPEIVAIDGKTSRRAKGANGRALHLVSAWASSQRLVLGQEATDQKSNEISAVPLLLERLELKGALVTMDAMGCQRDIAAAILAKGADYLLALKGNQPSLHADVELFFQQSQGLEEAISLDGDHGRIETRRAVVSTDISWLKLDRVAPGEHRFPGIAMIGMLEATIENGAKTTTSRRFYISSAPLSATSLLRAARAHWGVENNLHWIMDVVFHDDLMRLRTQNGPANMALIRHTALNLLKNGPGKHSFKIKRKMAGWSDDYLLKTITQTPKIK